MTTYTRRPLTVEAMQMPAINWAFDPEETPDDREGRLNADCQPVFDFLEGTGFVYSPLSGFGLASNGRYLPALAGNWLIRWPDGAVSQRDDEAFAAEFVTKSGLI